MEAKLIDCHARAADAHLSRTDLLDCARDAYYLRRVRAIVELMTGRVLSRVLVQPGPWCPAGSLSHSLRADMAYWVEETQDVHDALEVLLACDAGTHAAMVERYAAARAGAEADALTADDVAEAEFERRAA